MRLGHYILTNFNLPRSFGGGAKRTPSADWLRRRLTVFERYCLPSVLGQTERRFTWLIRFDPSTPVDVLRRVARHGAPVEVITEPFRRRIDRDLAENGVERLLLGRLDNDDAIHRDFAGYVRSRVDGSTKIVDVKGYQLDVRKGRRDLYFGKYVETHRCPTPFISLVAPARPGFPMVDAHPHTDMERFYPRDDCQHLYFLQIVHGDNAANKIVGRRVEERVDLSAFGLS